MAAGNGWKTVGLAAAMALLPQAAAALCTSEGVKPLQGVLERFVNADCAECWRDAATPDAAANVIALDWVLPGAKGDDAPLSAVAQREGLQRLEARKRAVPANADAHTTLRSGAQPKLRVAQGASFNDYIAASIEFKAQAAESWDAWLLLVEELPAGAEGSPVARNLVRNVLRLEPAKALAQLREMRSMQIHEGAKPDNLRLVALLHDGRGRLRAVTRTICQP